MLGKYDPLGNQEPSGLLQSFLLLLIAKLLWEIDLIEVTGVEDFAGL